MAEVTLRRADDLTDAERTAWRGLVETLPEFDGPYFRPEFTEHVAAVRDDVYVAVLSVGGEPRGFFPFQKHNRVGRPVAGRLSDFQAVVVSADVRWTAAELLRGCGLRSWQFDHLLLGQSAFEPYHWFVGESRFLDLSNGFEAYEQERRAAGASDVKNTLRKERKLKREATCRWEPRADDDAFERLLAWKSEQYHRTGLADVFSYPWTVELLQRLRTADTPGFGGAFSALYADDELLAVHLGMRSGNVLHYWFPAFGDAWQNCSPGLVLLVEVARHAAENGISRIDLGKGDERYKLQFGSGSIPVAEGVVERASVSSLMRFGWQRTKAWVKESPLACAARGPARLLRAVRERSEFE